MNTYEVTFFYSPILRKLFLTAIIVFSFSFTPLNAQEGIISSVYIAERTALQKMHEAKKAGNKAEIERLSAEIKELVNQKKSWAKDLLKLTESSIEKNISENSPELSPQQRDSLTYKLENLKSEMRIVEFQLEENKWGFFINNRKLNDLVEEYKGMLQSIYDYANEIIARNQKQIKESQQSLEQIIKEHEEEYQRYEESIQKLKESLPEISRQVAEKRLPATAVKDRETSIENSLKSLAAMRTKLDAGDYTSRIFNWTSSNHFRGRIKTSQDEIDKLNAALADESMRHRYGNRFGTPSIAECKKRIEDLRNEIEEQRALYTAEEWGNRKELRQKRQNLHVRILQLQEQLGLKDEKLAALKERKHELEKFLFHDFVTELPPEESGFIKAIKWLTETIEKVEKVAEKFEKLKRITAVVKCGNPAQAVNLIFKEATGRDLVERLAEKLLPEKVLQNELVKKLINGESVSRSELLKQAAIEALPPEARKEVEHAVDFFSAARSSDIRNLIAQKGFERAMRVIDSQPELKKAWETFDQAHKIMQNPRIIQDRLRDAVEERVKLELQAKGQQITAELVDAEMKKQIEKYSEKVRLIEEDMLKGRRLVAEVVTQGALLTVKNAVEARIGLKEPGKSAVENLITNYPLPDE